MVDNFESEPRRLWFTSPPAVSRESDEIRAEILQGLLNEVKYHAGVYTSILKEAEASWRIPASASSWFIGPYRIRPPSTTGPPNAP